MLKLCVTAVVLIIVTRLIAGADEKWSAKVSPISSSDGAESIAGAALKPPATSYRYGG